MNNIYYRPAVRNSRRNNKIPSGFKNLLKPLTILLGVLLVVWLFMQVWGLVSHLKGTKFKTAVTVYLAEGATIQKQSYGTSQFLPMLSGELALEGDSIRTLDKTRAVLEFFNGTVLRLEENSSVTLVKLDDNKKEDTIFVELTSGKAWLNKPEATKLKSNLKVSTDYLSVNSIGTIFGVEAGLPESIIVAEGTVLVDVLDATKNDKVIDQIKVISGQQMYVDSEAYASFLQRETPRVLGAVSADYTSSTWFKWNIKEDKDPTNFNVDSFLTDSEDYINNFDEFTDVDNLLEDSDDFEDDSNIDSEAMAVIGFPKNDDVISSDTVEITGTVPMNTQAVMVTSFEDGVPNPYVLKGFKPGDGTFRYIAKYMPEGGGNLLIGENRFEVIVVDDNGRESKPSTVTFTVKIEDQSENNQSNSGATDVPDAKDVDVSQLEYNSNLDAPVITTVNDQAFTEGFTLTSERGVVEGTIGNWAKSIVVNGYKLQQYDEFSGKFTYILSKGFGTLKAGENVLVIYGFNEAGERGTPLKVTINY